MCVCVCVCVCVCGGGVGWGNPLILKDMPLKIGHYFFYLYGFQCTYKYHVACC